MPLTINIITNKYFQQIAINQYMILTGVSKNKIVLDFPCVYSLFCWFTSYFYFILRIIRNFQNKAHFISKLHIYNT